MNEIEVIGRKTIEVEELRADLSEARELILLLAGERGVTHVVRHEERAQSVRVERVDGGVRFHINEVPKGADNDDDIEE